MIQAVHLRWFKHRLCSKHRLGWKLISMDRDSLFISHNCPLSILINFKSIVLCLEFLIDQQSDRRRHKPGLDRGNVTGYGCWD